MLTGTHRVTHLIALRGNAGDYPENTLPALRSAHALGVRFVLVDVQLAADEVPVVSRDAALARTAGVDVSVFDLAARELAALEVAEADRFGDRHRGTRLASLADVVDHCTSHPESTLLLDLRRESLERFGAQAVVQRVQRAVRAIRGQCVLVSRDLGAIHLARSTGTPRVGWVLPAYDSHSRLKYEALQPELLLVDADAVPADVTRLWRGPWRWVVLDVADAEAAQAWAARGADFVATSAVAPLSADLRARARTTPVP